MIVMKFGGTSVESKEAIMRVAGIVRQQQQRHPVVVVSAMGKTTNKLLAAATEAAAGRRDQALAIIDELRVTIWLTVWPWPAPLLPNSTALSAAISSGSKNS